MNPFLLCHLPEPLLLRAPRMRGRGRNAFALVVTLLILSLLVVIAVSFLSSMSAEHQTADAYAASGNAEQATRAAVDSATAMLAESLRDFPDSVTAWDPLQTANDNNTPANEGTDLYLRAMGTSAMVNGATFTAANPFPDGTPGPGATPVPANSATGNNPNNLACETFVLPLISGVPGGRAQLLSVKQQQKIFPAAMNLSVSDPTQQTWVDLNVRRFGKSAAYPNGDVQGVIGSPPGWAGVAPKPARAYWVNVKGSDGLITSRYAFWIDDESFRLNTSLAGPSAAALAASSTAPPPPQPPDNTAQPTPFPSPASTPSLAGVSTTRGLQPSDLMMIGTLTRAGDTSANNDAGTIMSTRVNYPGLFFPDPLAFSHAFDDSTTPTQLIDWTRYLTTNQSGALNLTRHGSQRLNLNSTISTASDTTTIQRQVDQLVQTMEFHLPYFGERFYRMSTATDKTTLNNTGQVLGSPKVPSATVGTDNSQIYYYKVAANLRDSVDADSQPTTIGIGGKVGTPLYGGLVAVSPNTQPNAPLDDPSYGSAVNNEFWAQGKESSPLIQEVAVRYRPLAITTKNPTGSAYPKGHYELQVDYYVEFWNMSDRDICAAPQPATSSYSSAANLGSANLWIRYQQSWKAYPATSVLQSDGSTTGEVLVDNHTPADWELDLTNNVINAISGAQDGTGIKPLGVVFPAGAVTIVTTDPNYASYTYKELAGNINYPATNVANMANVYYCQLVAGQRKYTGKVFDPTYNDVDNNDGLAMGNEFGIVNPTTFSDTEVSLVNSRGYFDVVRGAITKTNTTGAVVHTNTDKYTTEQGYVNDFSYGSSLMGNIADQYAAQPSEMGDPRTNNEQLSVSINYVGADGTHLVPSKRTLGSPNYTDLQPATTTANQGWGDYYPLPTASNYTNGTAANAPSVNADAPLTSIGQLGDVFDPMRVPGTSGISYSRGGGRTFKIGQHDDRYSNDPSGNAANTSADNVSASNGWASWRLADVFDVADPVELPGRININGVQRDNGAALLALFQGFKFQPPTTNDRIVHGDAISGLATSSQPGQGQPLNTTGFSQLISQMQTRLTNTSAANGPSGPFFERGELGELGTGSNMLFGVNSTAPNKLLVSSVDMNTTMDHSREELFRRIAQMICTRGDTFTVYAVGQSIVQPPGTTAATADTATKKITGTQRMRVTFRLVPQTWDAANNRYKAFHPAYTTKTDGSGVIDQINNFTPASSTSTPTADTSAVVTRFAKPDRYNVQVLQSIVY